VGPNYFYMMRILQWVKVQIKLWFHAYLRYIIIVVICLFIECNDLYFQWLKKLRWVLTNCVSRYDADSKVQWVKVQIKEDMYGSMHI
jgi:hypothetical protein